MSARNIVSLGRIYSVGSTLIDTFDGVSNTAAHATSRESHFGRIYIVDSI